MLQFFRKPIIRRLFLLIIAVAIAVYSTLELKDYLEQQRPSEQVLVAKNDIPAYSVITSNDLGYLTKPVGSRSQESIQDPNQIIGRAAAMTIFKGEEILPAKLMDSPLVIGETERAIGVPVDIVRAVGMNLAPGNKVDIYWLPKEEETTLPGQEKGPPQKAQAIAYDAIVLDILNQKNDSMFSGLVPLPETQGARQNNTNSDAPSVAVLRIKSSEVQDVVTAVEKGSIYLVKRR